MVHLYLADVSYLPDPLERSEICRNLPKGRQEKIKRLRNFDQRRQSLGAGLLLQKVMMHYGIPEDKLKIGVSGKPECEGLEFNLSHSGRMVACAVGEKPVGCDVEQLREAPKKLASRFFSEKEKEYLGAFSAKDYDEEFYRLWTMKESYVKFTGEGLRLPLNAFEIVITDEIRVLRGGKIQSCSLREYHVPGYRVTVCSEEAPAMKGVSMVGL